MKSLNHQIKRIARTSLLAGSVVSALAAPNAIAASGTTQVDITFPPLLILYYYDNIAVTVDAANFATATGADAPANCTADAPGVECGVATVSTPTLTAAALGSITADADIATDAAPAAVTTTVNFDINNAWAVRSLGLASMTASISNDSGDFSNVTTDRAGAGNLSSSLTLGAANTGDIQFDVDLTALADATSATGQVTITVIPTP